jgi:glycosyltransferase involved in cell wall biosynthesis
MANPKKILQVCRLTPLWGMDLFREISHTFKPEDYQVTTVFLSGKPPTHPVTPSYTGQVLYWQINHKLPGWRFLAFIKLYRLCAQQGFDAVFCHHYKPTVITHLVSRFCAIGQCYSIHHNTGNFKQRHRQWFCRTFLTKCWQFITVSKGVKQDLITTHTGLMENQVHIIHNAIDAKWVESQQLTRLAARNALNLNNTDFVFGTIGRLVSNKGHRFFLHAFAEIAPQVSNARIVIIGHGPLANELMALANTLHIAAQVTIISGDIAQHALRYARAFDVFVLPSLVEGFGLVLLEAMAAQLPIIATHVGGIPEVLGQQHGMIIPAANSSALSQAMLAYHQLSNEARLQLGTNNYYHLQQHFSTQRYHQQFRQLLTEKTGL